MYVRNGLRCASGEVCHGLGRVQKSLDDLGFKSGQVWRGLHILVCESVKIRKSLDNLG